MSRTTWIAALTVVVFLAVTPRPLYSYTDPGSGALIYQVGYAAVLGGMFYLRRLINRVFGRRK